MGKVEVVAHDPRWRDAFEAEARQVAAALGGNVVAVHHIGSTAIPGIHAKPIIDFLVEVRDIAEVDGRGPAMDLAKGFRAALDVLGKGNAAHGSHR